MLKRTKSILYECSNLYHGAEKVMNLELSFIAAQKKNWNAIKMFIVL